MVKDAEAHADEAHKLRELADAKNQAETLAYQTEKSLKEHRDKLDAAEAATIEGRIMELKQALEGGDLADDPREDRGAPGGVAASWPRRVYAKATAAQASSRRADAASLAVADDEVVEDADSRSSTRRCGEGVSDELRIDAVDEQVPRPMTLGRRRGATRPRASTRRGGARAPSRGAARRVPGRPAAAAADFDNFRKRAPRDQQALVGARRASGS